MYVCYDQSVLQKDISDVVRNRHDQHSPERHDRLMTAPRPYHPDATISALSAALTAYDEGWLDDEEINLLLSLVDTGLDCSLPSCFGGLVDDLIRLADDVIEAGDMSLT
jgi:hypothetical protein